MSNMIHCQFCQQAFVMEKYLASHITGVHKKKMTNHEHCGNQWSLCCDIVERVKKQLDFTKQKVDGKMEDKIEQHDLLHILQKILGI